MFFNRQLDATRQRQQQLMARSGRLRQRLADDVQVLRRPLALADQVRHGWQWLRAHPEVLAGSALLLALVQPRRAWRLASRAWAGWQLWQRLQQGWTARTLPPR
jgi:hypothetical protein